MSDIDLDAIRRREEAASREVYRLCDGGRFTMTVPPREDTDSDTVIIASLEDIDTLAAEVDRLRRENAALQQLVTSTEKDVAALTADRDRALEESARVGRCGSVGQPTLGSAGRPVFSPPVCALPAGHAGWHRGDDAEWSDPAPAPRDTDLTQQVRALVKRYGAPVVAAEAARQASRH